MVDAVSCDPSFPVVGIGASAGGLEAFTLLLKALPADCGMAYVLVQHLDPTHDSKLSELLAKATRMPVVEATESLRLEPDHVYVIAPGKSLTLGSDGRLLVAPRPEARSPHLPIDSFFRSLAEERQSGAIGVVLSGSGSDGTLGLEAIKAAGGVTFAQDEASSTFAGMPQSALHSGCVDLVLPPERIAAELARMGGHAYLKGAPPALYQGATPADEEIDDGGFKTVIGLLRAAHDVDFSAYRETTIQRRILRRMMLQGGTDVVRYIERLRGNRAELDLLFHDILIGVTRFFRDPEVFDALKERVFPEIVANRKGDAPIRIWVPGCSSGQEAYSLAIALIEFLDRIPAPPPEIAIFATDVSDLVSLQKARAGLYSESIEAEVSPERLRRFFKKEDGHWRISKALREIVVFARQNVAADPPFSRVDLVSCRNLLIYLSPQLQKRVLPTFHYALNPNGFLLLGASESIGTFGDLFAVVDATHRIYSRKAAPARPYPHFRADEHQQRVLAGANAAPQAQPAALDWQREADRVAAGRYVPPGVLINDAFDILQFRGQTGPFLAPAPGEPSLNLLKMAREGLFVALRGAVLACQKSGESVREADVRVHGETGDRRVALHVLPVKLPQVAEHCFLVLFEEPEGEAAQVAAAVAATRPPPADAGDAGELEQLRRELASTREYLQSVIEQQDATNGELRSAGEEILSSNEELQSTNEELETAKEEQQSVNEELITVNEQLQHRNAELARLNDDTTNLLASADVAELVLGLDLRIRRFSPAAAKLFELRAGDIGRPIGHMRRVVEMPELEALVAQVIASAQPAERETREADGRCWQVRVQPYRTADGRIDGAVLVVLDVTSLRTAQDALREANDYNKAIVETVRESLLVLDRDFRVRSANHAFYAGFRVSEQETLGRPLFELGNGQWNIAELRRQLASVLSSDTAFADFEIRHTFEAIGARVMRLNARRVQRSGEPTELILLAIEDFSVLSRLEGDAALHLGQVEEESRRKTEFLALLAHELRNPLAPMTNALYVLKRLGNADPKAERMRAMIERQVWHLSRLVDDLLDVARVSRGSVELRKARVDVGELLERSVEAARVRGQGSGIEITLERPARPMPADLDPTRFAQAVDNLLGNAAKFTDRGGRIDVTLARAGREALVLVSDNGIGIAPEGLPMVFEMFSQLDRSLARSSGGLGIGLSLVKTFIEAHGGSVAARSAGQGRGSEFEIRLPLAAEAPESEVRAEAVPQTPRWVEPAEAGVAADAAGMRRILVVDDNADAAESLEALLASKGHEVRAAFDGATALGMAAQWQPEAMFLDIGMPGLSGHDVARRVRGEPWGRTVLLVALTGWGQPEDRQRSSEAGFDAHLVKPADQASLDKVLEQVPRSPAE